jgi:hypothetical protein
MQWWLIWSKFWRAVDHFADALNGATAKLRAHCDLPVTEEVPAIEHEPTLNGKGKRVLAAK